MPPVETFSEMLARLGIAENVAAGARQKWSSHKPEWKLYLVMRYMYSISCARDFRKPVEKMYPQIADRYRSVIAAPMDLGTLLLQTMRGVLTPEMLRDGLKLVFHNSLSFNDEAPMMKAISLHLLKTAEGLYEEYFRRPFNPISNTETEQREELFVVKTLLRKRTLRFQSVRHLPLRYDEVNELHHLIQDIIAHHRSKCGVEEQGNWDGEDPAGKTGVVDGFCMHVDRYQTIYRGVSDEGRRISANENAVITLDSMLRGFVEASVCDRSDPRGDKFVASGQLVPAIAAIVELYQLGMMPPTAAAITLRAGAMNFLFDLDHTLGHMFVKLEERLLRGTSSSSVWQRPLMLGWAMAG